VLGEAGPLPRPHEQENQAIETTNATALEERTFNFFHPQSFDLWPSRILCPATHPCNRLYRSAPSRAVDVREAVIVHPFAHGAFCDHMSCVQKGSRSSARSSC
jgi:hypothetical protein